MARDASAPLRAAQGLFGRSTSRRTLLRAAIGGAIVALATPMRALAAVPIERAIALRSVHTGETLSLVYRVDDDYQPGALARVNDLLRDHRTGDVMVMKPELLDLLYDLRAEVGAREPYDVISGYRSPATNSMLRAQGRQVGRRSYHMKGMAIDLRVADVPTRRLREAALDLGRGGVGYYAKSDFVHVDVGPVRFW